MKVKYVLINPEDVISDLEKNQFGPNGCISRLNYGKAEPEFNVSYRYFNSCLEGIKKGEKEVDVSASFNYYGYGLTQQDIRSELSKVFIIKDIKNSRKEGKTIYVEYITANKYGKIKNNPNIMNEIKEKYQELEKSLSKLKKYNDLQKSIIANELLKNFYEELQKRENIIISEEKESWNKESIILGGGKDYKICSLLYNYNNEQYSVEAMIRFDDSSEMLLSNFERNNDFIYIYVDISRQSEDGSIERIMSLNKSCSSNEKYALDISCHLSDYLYYRYEISNGKERYLVQTEKPSYDSIREVNKDDFDRVANIMIDPSIIDQIYDLINSKIKMTLKNSDDNNPKELMNWHSDVKRLKLDLKKLNKKR